MSKLEAIKGKLVSANDQFAKQFPGDPTSRQPVHVVYGGAHLFKANTARKLGDLALKALKENAPNAQALGVTDEVYAKVLDKLAREPVEDLRIDFEDGYGNRSDAEEDSHAEAAAREMAAGITALSLPPFSGIRIKSLSNELFDRASKTLEIFLSTLVSESKGRLPENFVVTVPKVSSAEQASAAVGLLEYHEKRLRLPARLIALELMIETPQAVTNLSKLIDASEGRCRGMHFGTYDYTAACGITAAHQRMNHPAAEFAKHAMQVAAAQTGVMISDGATTTMPVGSKEGVLQAWRLSFENIRHSLEGGFYQGWDLHPAQLVARYAAVYSFFLEGLEPASQRLKAFIDKAAQATLLGDAFDDAATGQGLLNYFLRALNCGAISEAEAMARSGLTLDELRTRSFLKILKIRRGQ